MQTFSNILILSAVVVTILSWILRKKQQEELIKLSKNFDSLLSKLKIKLKTIGRI